MTSDGTGIATSAEILRRAIELDERNAEPLGQTELPVESLKEIAADLDISTVALLAAIADSRAGVLRDATLIDRIVGPPVVWSNRSLTVDERVASERAQAWLSTGHGLRSRVRPDGVIVAQKRTDLVGKLGSQIRQVQGLGELGKATEVQVAAVGASEDDDQNQGQSAVSLAADIASQRNEAIATGSAVSIGGAVAFGLATTVAGPLALIGIPLVVGAGGVVARLMHKSTITQTLASVEETMDGISQGTPPPRPLDSLKSTSQQVLRSRRSGPD